jgi:hypothetical protein
MSYDASAQLRYASIRQHFAGLALHALLGLRGTQDRDITVKLAVEFADRLLKELGRTTE